jgi:acyl-CoA synthetase (AMP-forming)/AMP-acid ligase II
VFIPLHIMSFLQRAVKLYPEKAAVQCGSEEFTYREHYDRINRFSNALLALGVKQGDRVGWLSPNCHRMLEAFYAVTRLGAVFVPMNFRLIPSDFSYILNHSESKLLFVDEKLVDSIKPIRDELHTVAEIIILTDRASNPADYKSYETMLADSSPGELPQIDVDENEVSTLLYTSGTTGRPKGVMLTQRNIYLNAVSFIMHMQTTEDDVLLHTLPLFHCNGWGMPFAVTAMGGSHVLLRKPEPQQVFELMEREGVSIACMAPAVLNSLLSFPKAEQYKLERKPRLVVAGSAPPAAFIKDLSARFGWSFTQIYGLTETSPVLTVSKIKSHLKGRSVEERYQLLAKAGNEAIGVEVRVVDEEERDVKADGQEVGEVVARSNVVMAGYWRQPEETEQVIRNGWFHTGDMATLDEEGYIDVVDRKKDLIISGGENVSSIEVEGVIYQHPAVLECAIIAVPDQKWGEIPLAAVVIRQGQQLTEAELTKFCRERMAHFKAPKRVEFIDSLPRTATGKVKKNELREKYWSGETKRVH